MRPLNKKIKKIVKAYGAVWKKESCCELLAGKSLNGVESCCVAAGFVICQILSANVKLLKRIKDSRD